VTPHLLVIGHRGSAGTAPENTLPSFRAAADAGADMIELDVRLAADNVLVVHHDMSLRRTTGIGRRVRDVGANEIAGLDAGAWFGRQFRGVRVPDLAGVLAWRPARLGLNIEVKTGGDPRGPSAYVEALLGLIDRIPPAKLLVSSFDDTFLTRLHRAAPRMPLGCLFMPVRDWVRGPATLARATGARVFICSAHQGGGARVRAAQAAGLAVYVYGITTVRQARRCHALGVSGIITDFPARMRQSLNRTGPSI
jgi:glycerophosphoryl diester phosphodiesterase